MKEKNSHLHSFLCPMGSQSWCSPLFSTRCKPYCKASKKTIVHLLSVSVLNTISVNSKFGYTPDLIGASESNHIPPLSYITTGGESRHISVLRSGVSKPSPHQVLLWLPYMFGSIRQPFLTYPYTFPWNCTAKSKPTLNGSIIGTWPTLSPAAAALLSEWAHKSFS